MILTIIKVELPRLIPRRCSGGRFIINILVLEIATDLHWVGHGADLLHRATAGVACGDVDLEDFGKHLGPGVVAQWLDVAVVIVVPELETLFDLGVKCGLERVGQDPGGRPLAVPTEITAAHTKGQDLAAYGLDQPCNLVVGDGVEIAEPGEFAVTGVNEQDMVGQVRGRLGHPLGAATWTETAALTAECRDFLLLAHLADKPDKAAGGDAALEVGIELRADIVGERSSLRLAGGDEGAEMLLDDPVAGCELGTASLVGTRGWGNGHGDV